MSSASKLIFGTAIAVIGVFAAVVCFEKPDAAQNYRWCAYYDLGEGGATNCEFSSTMLAAVSGVGGSCEPDLQSQGSPRLYLSTKHSRRHSY
jgi:hypothetical protein